MLACRPARVIAAVLLGCGTAVTAMSPASEPLPPQTASHPAQVELTLRVESLAELLRHGELFHKLPDPAGLGVDRIVAFEDNPAFLYLRGISTRDAVRHKADPRRQARTPPAEQIRRILLIKPSVVMVADHVRAADPIRLRWTLESKSPLRFEGANLAGVAAEDRFLCRTLLPATDGRTISGPETARAGVPHRVSIHTSRAAKQMRLLHLVHLSRHNAPVVPRSALEVDDGTLRLQILLWDELRATHRVAKISLPEDGLSGKLGIFDREGDGFLDIPTRRLPAGILPMGEVGYRMLQGWDIPYQNLSLGLAVWDTGRPSSQLKQVVESGTVRPCRIVELGCGTGTDAVYLAGKGCDVTAIDIAPTALRLAEKKAQKASVKVRWLLADVLRLPELEPFDCLYDRGCYHAIRRDYPREYVAAVRKLTRPGARILVLAGNTNEEPSGLSSGPPRVSEEEIRGDFARGFKLIWLREFRFDPTPPQTQGALAWSALLERVADD